jgi:DNA-binding CsgD family transcriptional regulator
MEPPTRVVTLIGRDRELAALTGRLDQARAGRAGIVLVGGDAGIGKTRLLTELTSAVPDRVLWGACLPLGQRGLPFLALIDLLRGLTADERRLVPPAVRTLTSRDEVAGAAVSRSQLFQAVLDLLERLASRQPLIVVFEDLHWADTSLLDLIDFLTGSLRDQPIVLLATFRVDDPAFGSELREVLGEWERRPGASRLDLSPLPAADALRVVVERLEGHGAGRSEARRLAGRAGGNPFFLEQLAAAYGSGERIPRLLRDLLLNRTQALPAVALRVLRIASVGGVSIDEELVSAIAGLPLDEVRSLLRTAVALQLLTLDERGCRFRHALLAEALQADLLPAERRDHHAAYAAALLERGDAPPARLAVHHAYAGQAREALAAWVAAATQAERMFAFAEARHGLQSALELWGQVDAPEQLTGTTAVALRRRLAEATFAAGDAEAACRVARDLLDDLDPGGDPVASAMVHHRFARYLLDTAGHAEALHVQERAVALVPASPPSRERAEVIAGLARILLYEHRVGEARSCAEEAIALARTSGAVHAEVSARNTLGAAFVLDDGEAAPAIREALALARDLHDAHEQARSLWNLNAASFFAARWTEMLAEAEATTDALRRLAPGWVVKHVERVAAALFRLGRWDEAAATIAAAHREDPTQSARIGHPELLVARGESARAAALQDARRAAAVVGGTHERLWFLTDDAMVALADGRPSTALRIIDEVLVSAEGRYLPALLGYASVTGLRAAAEVACGRARTDGELGDARTIGRRCHAAIAGLVARPGRADGWKREATARAAQCDAELTRLEGQQEPAAWQIAVERWDALAVLYDAAYCRFRSAEAVIGCGGDRDEAARTLRDVLALLGRLREVRLATEVRRLARRARLDVGEAEGGAAGPFGLTGRENEVLRELAAGAGNRRIAEVLYISEKTVSVHVSNILRKLQVASRGEAAAVAITEGLVDVAELADHG